jgi:hypothetical protein
MVNVSPYGDTHLVSGLNTGSSRVTPGKRPSEIQYNIKGSLAPINLLTSDKV